ncbi:site-specific DNA-methyltransferase [Olsenella umbonata]|uniref:Site-specific DNA-methyltransferase n=1 Tax=Parafannyhessea umbonata TaxID=604330 RepID=A0A7X9TD12_9ACTN|nr:site-specific DNA-methyltransferase [Parafannyhessea umbonata]NMF26721.1 site-specific DNA-methyltransferase [Parafannyhessea umbonata]
MSDEIERLDLRSEDLVEERLEQMRQLVPEAFSEGGVDFDKLRLLLGDEVDEGDERYAFTWPGKADAIRQSQTTSHATLRPCIEKSRGRGGEDGSFDSDNVYIEGDNLEVLKLMQRAYHGRVKLVYIDPPYNTGSDFIYKDTFADTIEHYKEEANLSGQSNAKTDGRFHANWCSMMYPRLKLARELLSDDGIIIASIDESERTNLQLILNEVFGETNFAGEIIWKNSSKNDQAYISMQHEYLLVYVKDKGSNSGNWTEKKGGLEEIYSAFEGFHAKYGNDWKAIHKAALDWYNHFPPSSPVYASKHYSWMDERGVYFPADISGPNDGQYVYDVKHPVTGKPCKRPSRGWFCPQQEMERRVSEGLIHFGDDEKTVPNIKTYLKDTEQQSLPSILYKDGRVASKKLARMFGAKVFSNPKDDGVLSQLFKAMDVKSDDVVLDFFSGSATTGEAVERMNCSQRIAAKWILVQLPENLEDNLRTATGSNKKITANAIKYLRSHGKDPLLTELAEERLRLSGDEILGEISSDSGQLTLDGTSQSQPDIGFRVFRLDDSGIERPRDGQLLIDRRKPGRTDLDIIFEAMLRWGYELTYPVEEAKFAGYPCYSVAAGDLVCCMQPGLTTDALDAIAASQPRRVLMMDSAIDDTTKLNALAIFRRVEERTQQKIELRTV